MYYSGDACPTHPSPTPSHPMDREECKVNTTGLVFITLYLKSKVTVHIKSYLKHAYKIFFISFLFSKFL